MGINMELMRKKLAALRGEGKSDQEQVSGSSQMRATLTFVLCPLPMEIL